MGSQDAIVDRRGGFCFCREGYFSSGRSRMDAWKKFELFKGRNDAGFNAHGVSSNLFSSKKPMTSIRKGEKEEVSWNLRENSEQFLNQALKNDLKIFLDDYEAAEDSAERFCGDKEEKEYKKGCLVYNCTSTGFNTVKVLEKCQQMMKAHIEEI